MFLIGIYIAGFEPWVFWPDPVKFNFGSSSGSVLLPILALDPTPILDRLRQEKAEPAGSGSETLHTLQSIITKASSQTSIIAIINSQNVGSIPFRPVGYKKVRYVV